MGRITQVHRAVDSTTRYIKDLFYAYNLDGSVKSLTYPSGRVVNSAYDSAGRPLSALDSNGTPYTSNATYWPNGALYQQWTPKVYLRTDLNNRLQIGRSYADNGVVTAFYFDKSYTYGAQNNGNILSITNNKDATRTQSFTYDNLNRLGSAQNAGTDCTQVLPDGYTKFWGNSYGYDAWGNLLQEVPTKCSAENLSVTANSSNQLVGNSYDAAGNMTADGLHNYTYDAGDLLKTVGTTTYWYDADGQRFQKWLNGSGSKTYWYGVRGEVLAEGDAAGHLSAEYVFFGGKRAARVDIPSGAVQYYLSDHLGSTSMVASAAGAIENESEYYPWGRERQFSSSDGNHYKFTGYERDSESGNDNAEARYYGSRMGRFLSPDPLGGDITDPQSFNAYSYTTNNPINLTDPDGMDPYQLSYTSSWQVSGTGLWYYSPGYSPISSSQGGPGPALQGVMSAQDWINYQVAKNVSMSNSCFTPVCIPAATQEYSMANLHFREQQVGGGGGGRATIGPRYKPTLAFSAPGTTIGPDPDWSHSRQAACAAEGMKASVTDFLGGVMFANEIVALLQAGFHGSADPLKSLFSAGTAADVAKSGATYVAGHRSAVIAIRETASAAGFRVSGNALARGAGLFGKVAGVIGLGLSANAGYGGYKSCINN